MLDLESGVIGIVGTGWFHPGNATHVQNKKKKGSETQILDDF